MAGLLITGKPRCGKSYWLKKVGIPHLRRQGIRVVVLDPILGGLDPNIAKAQWGAEYVTNDANAFMAIFRASHHCAFVVDECGRLCTDYETRLKIEEIPVTGGNRGNLGIFVGQRCMMVPPNIRNLCDAAVLFRQQRKDLEELAALFDEPRIVEAATYGKGEYMMVEPFKEPTKHLLPLA